MMVAAWLLFSSIVLSVTVESQTDVSSFGIVTSDNLASDISALISLTLSWNTEQWECIINATILSNTFYGCITTDVQPEATLITNTLPSNTYSMKINLIEIGDEADDLIRIETVRIFDDDSNYYEINEFCLPSPFSNTDASGTSLELLECSYWCDRYRYNNFAVGGTQNAVLKIAYISFRPNVLNHPNEAHEGAVKPPMISEMGIKTLSTSDAQSSATFSLTLHWDDAVYEWSALKPLSSNTTFVKTVTQSTSSCEFSSDFSIKIESETSTDAVVIDRIIVTDESNYSYDIDYFCNSDKIQSEQKYGELGRMCDGNLNLYAMYDGFIYNGTEPNYFIWSENVFLNVNTDQQAFADSLLFNFDCGNNTAPSSKITKDDMLCIFKDDMNDPNATGWTFSGSYTESLTAVNCPGGSLDPCSRMGGGGDMIMQTLNISSVYPDIVIQYDMRLSNMPSGKSCSLYYSWNGGSSWSSAQYRTSEGTTPVLYANETWDAPDHIDSGYTTLTLKFYNNAVYSTEYCWVDHLYIFQFGDYLIAVDRFTGNDATGWTLYSGAFVTSNYLRLDDSNDYGVRQYSNINMYNNLVISFYAYYYDTACKLYFAYDDEPWIFLAWIPFEGNTGSSGGWVNLEYNIPDATVCGAEVLKMQFYGVCFWPDGLCGGIDNVKLWGNVNPNISSSVPTYPPTLQPTDTPSLHPSSFPTLQPSINPSQDPSALPTLQPTLNSSLNPTLQPTLNPSTTPLTYGPTYPPTLFVETTLDATDYRHHMTSATTARSTSRTFEFCILFAMNITTTLKKPNVMYKRFDILMLITNSTKFAIYTDITLSRMYDVVEFTDDVWNSFDIYVLAYMDITNGVAFSMECCSYLSDVSDIISAKLIHGSGEIEHHIQTLIEDHVSSPMVIINTDDEMDNTQSESAESSNENTESADQAQVNDDTYHDTVKVLTGFLVTTIFILIVAIALFILWYKKNKRIMIIEDGEKMQVAMHKKTKMRMHNVVENKPLGAVEKAQIGDQKEDVAMSKIDDPSISKAPGDLDKDEIKNNDAEGRVETKQDNPFLMDSDLSVSLVDDVWNGAFDDLEINLDDKRVPDEMMMDDDDVVGEINNTPM